MVGKREPGRTGPMREIPSAAQMKRYRALAASKGRREAGRFIIEGERAVRQIVQGHPDAILEIVTVTRPPPEFQRFPVRRYPQNHFRSIAFSKTPQGVLAVVRLPSGVYSDALPERPGSRILLLEDLQDPGNVGTLIRTAAAFGFDGILLSEGSADPFSPKAVQSTAGSILSIWIRRTARYLRLAEALKRKQYPLITADVGGGEDPSMLPGREKLLLALGNEAAGPSRSLTAMSDIRCRIPIAHDRAESLNVASAGAICLYLASRKPTNGGRS